MATDMTRWLHLMQEADAFSERTGYGLASVWALINHQDYDGALEKLNELCLAEERGEIKVSHAAGERQAEKHRRSRRSWREQNITTIRETVRQSKWILQRDMVP
jgi:hypothetical protein